MKYISSREQFLKAINEEVMSNEIGWGDSLVGRLFASVFRMAKLGVDLKRVDLLLQQLDGAIAKSIVSTNEELKKDIEEIESVGKIENVVEKEDVKEEEIDDAKEEVQTLDIPEPEKNEIILYLDKKKEELGLTLVDKEKSGVAVVSDKDSKTQTQTQAATMSGTASADVKGLNAAQTSVKKKKPDAATIEKWKKLRSKANAVKKERGENDPEFITFNKKATELETEFDFSGVGGVYERLFLEFVENNKQAQGTQSQAQGKDSVSEDLTKEKEKITNILTTKITEYQKKISTTKVEVTNCLIDPIEIVRIFNRAHRIMTKNNVPSGRSEGKISNARTNNWEKLDGSPVGTDGKGPVRNIKLFHKWNDGVLAILKKYDKYLKTSKQIMTNDGIKNITHPITDFMIDMLDDNKLFANTGHQAEYLKKHFDIDAKDKLSKGFRGSSTEGDGEDSKNKKNELTKSENLILVKKDIITGDDMKPGFVFVFKVGGKKPKNIVATVWKVESRTKKDQQVTALDKYVYIKYAIDNITYVEEYVKGVKKIDTVDYKNANNMTYNAVLPFTDKSTLKIKKGVDNNIYFFSKNNKDEKVVKFEGGLKEMDEMYQLVGEDTKLFALDLANIKNWSKLDNSPVVKFGGKEYLAFKAELVKKTVEKINADNKKNNTANTNTQNTNTTK